LVEGPEKLESDGVGKSDSVENGVVENPGWIVEIEWIAEEDSDGVAHYGIEDGFDEVGAADAGWADEKYGLEEVGSAGVVGGVVGPKPPKIAALE
jgi:hypothetical protein